MKIYDKDCSFRFELDSHMYIHEFCGKCDNIEDLKLELNGFFEIEKQFNKLPKDYWDEEAVKRYKKYSNILYNNAIVFLCNKINDGVVNKHMLIYVMKKAGKCEHFNQKYSTSVEINKNIKDINKVLKRKSIKRNVQCDKILQDAKKITFAGIVATLFSPFLYIANQIAKAFVLVAWVNQKYYKNLAQHGEMKVDKIKTIAMA